MENNSINPNQQPPNPVPAVTPPNKSKIIPIGLGVIVVLAITIGAYILGTKQSQPAVQNQQSSVVPTTIPTPTPDPTANWKTYTNTKYGYEIKYPNEWPIEDINPQIVTFNPGNKSYPKENTPWIRVTSDFNPGTTCGGPICNNDQTYSLENSVTIGGKSWNKWSNNTSDEIIYYLKSPSIAISIHHANKIGLIDQILSTFKFTDVGTSATPAPVTYKPGSNWHTVNNTTLGLTFCLPQNWNFSKNGDGSLSGNLIFYRDPAYAPTVAYIENIPYSGGSRREAYFKHWESEIPSIREIVSIKETNINGSIALTIYPVSASKAPPDGSLAAVWYANGKLWKASLSDWQSINQSQTAFLKDFYSVISCRL